jgi:hypothetical protein
MTENAVAAERFETWNDERIAVAIVLTPVGASICEVGNSPKVEAKVSSQAHTILFAKSGSTHLRNAFCIEAPWIRPARIKDPSSCDIGPTITLALEGSEIATYPIPRRIIVP